MTYKVTPETVAMPVGNTKNEVVIGKVAEQEESIEVVMAVSCDEVPQVGGALQNDLLMSALGGTLCEESVGQAAPTSHDEASQFGGALATSSTMGIPREMLCKESIGHVGA